MNSIHDNPQRTIEGMRQLISRLSFHYYIMDAPLVDDTGFDVAMKSLKYMLAQYPEYAAEDCPTKHVNHGAYNYLVKYKKEQCK